MAKKKPAAIKSEPFGESPDLEQAGPVKRGRGRPPKDHQPVLNDDPAFEGIAEMDNLMDLYQSAVAQLGSAHEDMEEFRKKLLDQMKERGMETYSHNGYTAFRAKQTQEVVKIKKVRMAKENKAA